MTGYAVLLGAALRRDRWQVLAWTVGITVLYWSQAVSVEGTYTTQAELDRAADALGGNAAFVAMTGPARALDTVGGQVFWQASAVGAVLAALMCMFLVGRHTRAEEESGRDELVRSAPVGRTAPVAVALTVAAGASLLVGLAVAGALAAYPLDLADSVATGLGLTAVGWVFSGVALLAAQLTASTRTTYGLTGLVLGVAYGLRAVGDVSGGGLSWLSPIGWYQGLHAYSGLRWWPVALLVAAAGATTAAALGVLNRRDIGSGVLPVRPGPARGELGSGLALAWRLQRGALLGWSAGVLAAGVAYGSIGDDVADVLGDSQTTRDLLAPVGDVVDGFYATALLMLGLLAAGFATSSALRPRGEESAGRTELLLSTGLSRLAWWGGHALVTLAGAFAVLAAGGVGVVVGFGVATGEWDTLTRFGLPVLAYAAPVLTCAGLAWLLAGAVPRWAPLAWLALGWAAVVLVLGELLDLPGWLQGISPFDHLASAPAEAVAVAPVLGVGLVAAGLVVSAAVALRRRDLR